MAVERSASRTAPATAALGALSRARVLSPLSGSTRANLATVLRAKEHPPLEKDVLLRHPAVRDLICFAMPHELLGESVGVAVVVKPDHTTTLRELRTGGSDAP